MAGYESKSLFLFSRAALSQPKRQLDLFGCFTQWQLTRKCYNSPTWLTRTAAQEIQRHSDKGETGKQTVCTSVRQFLQEDPEALQSRGGNVVRVRVRAGHILAPSKHPICGKYKGGKSGWKSCHILKVRGERNGRRNVSGHRLWSDKVELMSHALV